MTNGSRIRVINIPKLFTNASGAQVRIFHVDTLDLYLEGFSEQVNDDDHIVTMDVSPADNPAVGVWGDSAYGYWQPDPGALTLTSSITSSATSLQISASLPAQTISTTSGDFPQYVQIDEEVIRLTAAPSGSTSPQTFTVLRAQQGTFSDAHTAGAAVVGWPGSNWSL